MTILIPLPDHDFDPTEAAIPWQVLTHAGHRVVFATPGGDAARGDERMVSGRGLGPWRPLLRARRDARAAYAAMVDAPEFRAPVAYAEVERLALDGIVLPGGHAPGMRAYLEAEPLQRLIVAMVHAGKPVGAICHGVLLAARSIDPETGRSVLHGRRVTALTRSMELSAWLMTCLWLGAYYRTYPEPVETEVRRALGEQGAFAPGPFAMLRDAPDKPGRGFVVRDGNIVTARWPGDAYRFAHAFTEMLREPTPVAGPA